ncbi:MAG: hypothetical protein ABSD77_08980 [Verrucomicrobiota bacterium]
MSRIIGLVAISVVLLNRVSGQGFANLDFESTLLSAGGFPTTVSASAAFPGWSVFIGTNAQSTVLYNSATLGASSVAILAGGSHSPVSEVYDGNFSALLVSGNDGDSSLSQTGLVPASANSILLYVNMGPQRLATNFSISLGGQTIQMVALENYVSYSFILYGGNISNFAGQVADLTLTSLSVGNGGVTYFELDDIQFSSSPVPEPSALSLVGICFLLLYCRMQWPNKSLQQRRMASLVPLRGSHHLVPRA